MENEAEVPVKDEVSEIEQLEAPEAKSEVVEKPEAKPEAKTEEKPAKPPEGYVKHEALHEERMRRKELQQRLDAQEKRFQELVTRLAPKKEEPQVPAFEENPAAHLKAQTESIAKALEEQQKAIEDHRSQQQQNTQLQSMVRTYASKAAEFESKQPDFKDAYKFFLESRKNEYLAVGYAPEQVAQFLQNDELAIVHKAFQDEADPAERIYNTAKARGYAPKKDDKDKLDSIEKGLKANKTLSSASGTSPKTMTLESLAEMSEEEFAKVDYSTFAKAMGG